MGLFDKVFGGAATAQANPFTTPQDAFFAVLYACMSADGNVDDEEITALVSLAQQKALYRGHDMVSIYRRVAPKVIQFGNRQEAVALAASQVPAELRPTLFANCVDFAASDGFVGTAEQALSLDPQQCMNIVEVIMIKNKG
ncbi:TerB family tellurite resistance protein [Hymenobacter jeollabukensis]|uniref:TerB family tellurite resistance protein n=1 Tax=Hymenobacter jeollabukensis TaxID=2025313 RepID=A0A5R8WUW8_9BACT|nr:TerB family tellurite resistance protein [Hymenobacter jeollabukensis]TLM95559.1 TerB family tellurite resistance protein [Hymenobacter jeollabukensis]